MKKRAKHRKNPKVKKKPTYSPAASPRGGRRPVSAGEVDPRSYLKMRPTWRVANLDEVGPFGWHGRVDSVKALEILAKLRGFESMRWSEILVQAKKHT